MHFVNAIRHSYKYKIKLCIKVIKSCISPNKYFGHLHLFIDYEAIYNFELRIYTTYNILEIDYIYIYIYIYIDRITLYEKTYFLYLDMHSSIRKITCNLIFRIIGVCFIAINEVDPIM